MDLKQKMNVYVTFGLEITILFSKTGGQLHNYDRGTKKIKLKSRIEDEPQKINK